MSRRHAPPPPSPDETDDADERGRLDKWLWAARFFKTRALAAEAVDGGKVEVNGERAKRSKAIRPGDRLTLRLGPYEHEIVIRALSNYRGPAAEAQQLYEETTASLEQRQRLRDLMRLSPVTPEKGKLTRKDRREGERWKRGEGRG